jgi:hypothetical protein
MSQRRGLPAGTFALYYDDNVEGAAQGLEFTSKQRSSKLIGPCCC